MSGKPGLGWAPRRAALAAAVAMTLAGPPLKAQAICPLGAIDCRPAKPDFSLCAPHPLSGAFQQTSSAKHADRGNIQVAAENFDSPDGLLLQLDGKVRIVDQSSMLAADQATWRRDSGQWTASGAVRYRNRQLVLRAESMRGNKADKTASASDISYLLTRSHGNGEAAGVELLPGDLAELRKVSYSTCNPGARSWEFRAERIDLDRDAGVGHAHDVNLVVGGVPVFWLPWARFPTNDDRHSGLLYPTIGYADNSGFDITVPWYLNLAPNFDATLYPRILGRRGLMLGAEFRYLTPASRGQIRLDYLAHDRQAERERAALRATSHTRLSRDWSFHVNLNRVSDDRYFEDLGNDLERSATRMLTSSAYLRGRGDWWSAALGADVRQIVDPDFPEQLEPYRRLPRALFEAEFPLGGGLWGGIDSEVVAFSRDVGLDGSRIDLAPFVEWPLQGSWWHLTPRAAYRYTSYALDREQHASPHRALPILSLDGGLVFERDSDLGQGWTQTLEPRAFYLHVPYRDQSQLPLFDTGLGAFDFWQLFDSNRFAGADRQMDADNLSLTLTSRLLDAGGRQRFSASIGQIHYFDPPEVTLPGRPGRDATGSAYVAQFDVALSDDWSLRAAQQWDPASDHTELSTVGLQMRLGQDGVFNASYRYRRDFLEQVDFSAVYPLSPSWRLIGRWNRSLEDNRTLAALAGFEYDSCCLAVRLLGRRFVRSTEGDASNGLMLQIELKGLGSLGAHADDLLQHAILGYQ